MRDKLLPDCSLITLAVKWLMAKTGRCSKMRWASVKIKREEKRNCTKSGKKERNAGRKVNKRRKFLTISWCISLAVLAQCTQCIFKWLLSICPPPLPPSPHLPLCSCSCWCMCHIRFAPCPSLRSCWLCKNCVFSLMNLVTFPHCALLYLCVCVCVCVCVCKPCVLYAY